MVFDFGPAALTAASTAAANSRLLMEVVQRWVNASRNRSLVIVARFNEQAGLALHEN